MSTYPTYKPSGIEWLGDIPEHWELKRFRYCFDNGKGLSITKENLKDEGIPCVNYGEIHSKYGFEIDPERHSLLCVDEEYLETNSSSLLSYGNFVFADTSEDIEGAGNFTHLDSEQSIFAGYHTVISRLKIKAHTRFIAYCIDSLAYRTQIRSKVQGVKVYSITNKILKDTLLWLPAYKEQTAIANYLDDKTSKLDQLISNKKVQIEKLKELRQIEIYSAVTKGLDSSVNLKPSGVEWLGDIPEHWISTRVKNALVFDIGGTPSRNKIEYFDGNNLWVSIADLNKKDLITDTSEKITDEAVKDSNCKLIPKGSLLFSFKLSVGHLAFAGTDLYTNEAIAAFRPSDRLNVRFLKYLLQIEFESNANTNIYGAYLFNKETLGTAKIVFPQDSKEQTAIANYLDAKTSMLDQLVSNLENQINRLQEIRKIEIYNAVTGKIKVA